MVGVPYSQKITILGGPVIGGVHRNIGFISPNNSGLFLRNCERPRSSTVGNTALQLMIIIAWKYMEPRQILGR